MLKKCKISHNRYYSNRFLGIFSRFVDSGKKRQNTW